MRTKPLLLALCMWLSMGLLVAADNRSTGIVPSSSAAIQDWLNEPGALQCSDVEFLVGEFHTAAHVMFIQDMTDEQCTEPLEEFNISRQQLLDYIQNDFYVPEYSLAAPNAEGEIVIVIAGEQPTDETPFGSQHTHHDTGPNDHRHLPEGAGVAHQQPYSQWHTFRWRNGGEELGHIRHRVDLDHHYSHFHDDRNFLLTFHVTGDEAKKHQYRDIEGDGELRDRDRSEDEPTYSYYLFSVEYDYRYCNSRWWCFASWDEHSHLSDCDGGNHRTSTTGGCYID